MRFGPRTWSVASTLGIVVLAAGSWVPAALPAAVPTALSIRSGADHAPARVRDLAVRRGLRLGTAVDDGALRNEADYRRALARQFNMVEPENVMKWAIIHPGPHRYDFTAADRLVAFARRHRMTLRGHNLAWNVQNPDWLEHGHFSRDQAISILRDHIHTVVGRYRGKIAQWDVVNEALDAAGRYTDNPWLRAIGPDYIAMAFRFAHEADPRADLYYNDYDLTYPGPKADRILGLVAGLKQAGVPIDGLGVQFHVVPGTVSVSGVAEQMLRVRRLGLDYAITEFDVALRLPPTPAELRQQADITGGLLRTCLAARNCRTFNLWGFTDRHSWIPQFFPGFGAATPTDGQLRPKPAWVAVVDALELESRA